MSKRKHRGLGVAPGMRSLVNSPNDNTFTTGNREQRRGNRAAQLAQGTTYGSNTYDDQVMRAVESNTLEATTKLGVCSICGRAFDGMGHNAEPVNAGRCCDECNRDVVLVERMKILAARDKPTPTKKKREPLLCDKYLALPRDKRYSEQIWQTTKDNLRLAHRFVLSKAATEYCAQLVRDNPTFIADAQEFAIPPFERTYVEFDFPTWFEAVTGRVPDKDGDRRVGYLYTGNIVRSFCESGGTYGLDNGEVFLFPLQYHLWNPFTPDETTRLLKHMNMTTNALDVFYWGESALAFMHDCRVSWKTARTFDVISPSGEVIGKSDVGVKIANDQSTWDKVRLAALRKNHRFEFLTIDEPGHQLDNFKRNMQDVLGSRDMFQSICEGSCGDIRNAIVLLLFLNRTKKLQYVSELGTVQQMWRRRPIPLLAHRTITMHVNPLPKIIRINQHPGLGVRHRRHDVKGHFAHNKIAHANQQTHTHDWVENPERERQWRCACGGVRWWRPAHVRGYVEKGVVTADYKVVK